jgi:hypothetical protein
MKRKIFSIETISLDKETIARLDEDQLNGAFGGARAGGGSYSCAAAALAFEDEFELDTCCVCSCTSAVKCD